MSCKDFLATAADAACVSEFLKDLPGPVRQSLATVVMTLNTISQAEAFLSGEADKLLDHAVDLADEAVAAALMPLNSLFDLFDQIAVYTAPFSTCPTVNTIMAAYLAPVLQAQNAIQSNTWRKQQMKNAAVVGASLITQAIFAAASAAEPYGAVPQKAQAIFNDIQDCIGAVGPPFLPA